MKKLLNKTLSALVMHNVAWKMLKPFARVGAYLGFLRSHLSTLNNLSRAADIPRLFGKLTVMHGPFKNMRYPSLNAAGSTVYPKLLGSYETEIRPLIEQMCNRNYANVLDVGCAEGYYAVGMALRMQEVKVFAYDIDPAARSLCSEMAELNGVQEKVIIKSTCTPEELKNFSFKNKLLIICDCEGYELNLFNRDNLDNLKNCDLLIETHDFINMRITDNLIKLFSETHHVSVIKSIDDIEKAKVYQIQEIDHLELEVKKQLVGEYRPAIIEWIYCVSKVNNEKSAS